jgi:hypothetical protein
LFVGGTIFWDFSPRSIVQGVTQLMKFLKGCLIAIGGLTLAFFIVVLLFGRGGNQQVTSSNSQVTASTEANTPKPQPESSSVEAQKQLTLSKIDLLVQELRGRQQKVVNLETEKSRLEMDLRELDRKINLFIKENKDAAFCRDSANVGSDKNNRYEESVKNIAVGITLLCGATYLSDENFRKNVDYFVNELNKADSYASTLNNQVQTIQSQIDTENNSVEQGKAEISRLESGNQKEQLNSGSEATASSAKFPRSAKLVGENAGSQVNIRSAPSTLSNSPHYGTVGDSITALKQEKGDDGKTWYFVQFPSGATGWVSIDFVELR